MEKSTSKWLRQIWVPLMVVLVLTLLIVLAMTVWHEPIMSFFTSRNQFRDTISRAGIFAPLLFIIVQIAQIIIAPIPGQVVGIIGGMLFGWLGVIYNIIGSVIGFFIVFKLSRKFGRPLAEKIFSKKILKKFDFVTKRKGAMTLFLIFLLPFFPDDIVCYLAGLTVIPIKKLLMISLAGRLPAIILNNLIGAGMSREMIRPTAAIIFMIIALLVVCYYKRKQLHAFVSADNHLAYLKKHWPYKISHTIFFGLLLLLICAVIFIVIIAMPFHKLF
ncbi:MAG: VTT domain-containing protein [Candidatus Nomurabacteria bacterium]|jgi:uncharacterized membrane protein YdjX (TVP38/TMEM64 family)|nr:VTT domain-containing protein [Candidatus Nomurabacteria bacterium]